MSIEEFLSLCEEDVFKYLGEGPYIVIDNECNYHLMLDYDAIKSIAEDNLIAVFTYGYNIGDGKRYLPFEEFENYHNELEAEDLYIVIDEENKASYMDLPTLQMYYMEGKNNIKVNGMPVDCFFKRLVDKKINKEEEKKGFVL